MFLLCIYYRRKLVLLDESLKPDETISSEFVFIFIHTIEPRHEISNNVVCVTDKPTCTHTCSLIGAFASRLNII